MILGFFTKYLLWKHLLFTFSLRLSSWVEAEFTKMLSWIQMHILVKMYR